MRAGLFILPHVAFIQLANPNLTLLRRLQNCHGRGTCTSGVCECDVAWKGRWCEIYAGAPTNASSPNGTVQWQVEQYVVNEAVQTLSLVITRTRGAVGAISAIVQTADASALAGHDYVPFYEQTVMWANQDNADKFINVTIIQGTL